MKKQAMILAAGMGTRLGRLTRNMPKALVEYNGSPLLMHILKNLNEAGFTKIIVNTHHFSEQVISYIEKHKNKFGEIIISDEEKLLDTGGGIKKASEYFDHSPVLIHNVDIISNIDLNAFWEFHNDSKNLVNLAVKKRDTTRSLLINENNILCGWRDNRNGDEIITRPMEMHNPIAFSGIHILNKEFIDMLPKASSYNIMTEFLKFSKEIDINCYDHSGDTWKDIGKLEAFQ